MYELYDYYFIVLQLRTSFTIKLLSTDVNKMRDKVSCVSLLELQVDRDNFLVLNDIVQCSFGTSTMVRQIPDSSNEVIRSGNQCENGIKKMTTVDTTSSKCSKNF